MQQGLIEVMNFLLDKGRGLGLTLTGAITGYVPNILAVNERLTYEQVQEQYTLQMLVWTISGVVGVLTILAWIQKQVIKKRNGESSFIPQIFVKKKKEKDHE